MELPVSLRLPFAVIPRALSARSAGPTRGRPSNLAAKASASLTRWFRDPAMDLEDALPRTFRTKTLPSEMITRLVEVNRLPAAAQGFEMTFAAGPFPGHDVELTLVSRGEGDFGNDYEGVAGLPMECWLCPALERSIESAPRRISVKAAPLPAGVDPIWNPPPGVITRRFVEVSR